MSDEFRKMDENEMSDVSGGKHHHRHEEQPAGSIEMKENLPHESHKKKHCPKCGSNEVKGAKFYFSETKRLHDGQYCDKCGAKWIYGDPI